MVAKLKDIALTDIILPEDRARSYDPLKAEALAGSIEAQGLLHPITVRKEGAKYRLVCGFHRFKAMEISKASTISAMITDLDDDAARLAEVMENLARAELIALDRCQHLYELKQVYERMYPEAKHGGDRKSEKIKVQSLHFDPDMPEVFGFAEHIAEHIGLSKRSIYLAVKIWKGLSKETREALYMTDLAKKQTELKALSELSARKQAQVLELIFAEDNEIRNVASAVAAIDGGVVLTPSAREFERIRVGLEGLPEESFDRLIGAQADRVIASLKRTGAL